MKIRDQITSYIEQSGLDVAANFFGKKESTVKTWLKTKNYPMDAVELFMEGIDQDAQDFRENKEVAGIPQVSPPPEATPSNTMDDLTARVLAIENYLSALNTYNTSNPAAMTDPAPSNTRPTVAWDQADPRHVGFSSNVRPADTVQTVRTLSVGERMVTPGALPTPDSNLPAWMKPRQLRP